MSSLGNYNRIIILHLSDIHFGLYFNYTIAEMAKFENAIYAAIEASNRNPEIVKSIGSIEKGSISYLLCTGDLTSRGSGEYMDIAGNFLQRAAVGLGINKSKVIICPGNHDVDQRYTQAYENTVKIEGKGKKRIETKLRREEWGGDHFVHYLKVANKLYSDVEESFIPKRPPNPGISFRPEDIFSIHFYQQDNLLVFSLNSAVKESHLEEDHFGYVGHDQISMLKEEFAKIVNAYPQTNFDTVFKIALVHHSVNAHDNLDGAAMRDPIYYQNWLRQFNISLVLHGHQHFAEAKYTKRGDYELVEVGAGSFGANAQQTGDNRMSLNFISLQPSFGSSTNITIVPVLFNRTENQWERKSSNIDNYSIQPLGDYASTLARRVGLSTAYNSLTEECGNILGNQPTRIEGSDLALKSYEEALGLSKSFRATSFLDSPFWGGPLGRNVLDANLKLAKKVSDARRIFLVDGQVETYIRRCVIEAYRQHLSGKSKLWKRLKQTNTNLKLLDNSFDMKIINSEYMDGLPDIYNRNLDEVALYILNDGPTRTVRRVDVFNRNEAGDIIGSNVYAGESCDPYIYDRISESFENAWEHPAIYGIKDYINEVTAEMQLVEDEVVLSQSDLLAFKGLVRDEHATLVEEANFLVRKLRELSTNKQQTKYEKYLDVGTCIGRYPDLLKSLNLVGNSTAVDIDREVAYYMRVRGEKSPHFIHGDIRKSKLTASLNGPYDLITCLCATACQFGTEIEARWNNITGFEAGLRNMISLLAPKGLLVFSSWIDYPNNPLLPIYENNVRAHIRNNIPSESLIYRIIESYGDALTLRPFGEVANLLVYGIFKK